jgi:hypothetical protein
MPIKTARPLRVKAEGARLIKGRYLGGVILELIIEIDFLETDKTKVTGD